MYEYVTRHVYNCVWREDTGFLPDTLALQTVSLDDFHTPNALAHTAKG